MTVSPADNNAAANGTTSFTRTYNSGTAVTVTAPATAGNNTFTSWAGLHLRIRPKPAGHDEREHRRHRDLCVAEDHAHRHRDTGFVRHHHGAVSVGFRLCQRRTGNPVPTGSVTLSSGTYSFRRDSLAAVAPLSTCPPVRWPWVQTR